MFNEMCDELYIANVSNYSLLKYVLLNNYILLSYEEKGGIIFLNRRETFLLDMLIYERGQASRKC